jgi:hypothetical protein
MNDHVSGNLDMFDESCSEVKKRLGAMCRLVSYSLPRHTTPPSRLTIAR